MQRMVLEGAARSVEREQLWNEQSLEEKLIDRVTRLRGRCFFFFLNVWFFACDRSSDLFGAGCCCCYFLFVLAAPLFSLSHSLQIFQK